MAVWMFLLLLSAGRQVSSDDSCDRYHVNRRQTICCDGIVYLRSGFQQACCGSVAYDSQHYMCCGKTIVHREGRKPRCCGDQAYDAHVQRCKDGYLYDRTGIGTTCCRTYAGWTCCRRGEYCCSGADRLSGRRQNQVDIPGFRPACCLVTSTQERALCCKVATEKAWFLPPCCDTDEVRPLCCMKPDGDWQCCAASEGYCCEADDLPVRPPTRAPGRLPAPRPPPPPPPPSIGVTVAPPWRTLAPPRRLPPEPHFVTAALEIVTRPTVVPARRPRPPIPPRPRPVTARPVTARPVTARPVTPRPRPALTTPAGPRAVPDCCVGPNMPACCFTITRWTTCCQTYPRRSRYPAVGSLSALRSCCIGVTRPACCYTWTVNCCIEYWAATSQKPARPTTVERRLVTSLPDVAALEQQAPFEGQMASCCSSSSKRQCCIYGLRVTGRTPMCCDGIMMSALTTARQQQSTRAAPLSNPYGDYIQLGDQSVITAIEEDLSCCGLTGAELRHCCTRGYQRNGFQPECCGHDMTEHMDARADVAADVAYLYVADEAVRGDEGASLGCCNASHADRDHCCRIGYMTTGETQACCETDSKGRGTEDKKTEAGVLSRPKSAGSSRDSSEAEEQPSCCDIDTEQFQSCCTKYQTADCCPRLVDRPDVLNATKIPEQPPSNQPTTFLCCRAIDEKTRRRCCRTNIDGITHHPMCCPETSTSRRTRHHRGERRPRLRGLRYVIRKHISAMGGLVDMCGGILYDKTTHVCCSGKLSVKQGSLSKCCGETSYDAAMYQCCPGNMGLWKDEPKFKK